MELVEMVTNIMTKNGLVMSFLVVGAVMALANALGKATKGRIAGSAIAIVFGLILALVGGLVTGGEKGLSDIAMFSGLAVMGGGMLRDFSIVSTAFGASLEEIKKPAFPVFSPCSLASSSPSLLERSSRSPLDIRVRLIWPLSALVPSPSLWARLRARLWEHPPRSWQFPSPSVF